MLKPYDKEELEEKRKEPFDPGGSALPEFEWVCLLTPTSFQTEDSDF